MAYTRFGKDAKLFSFVSRKLILRADLQRPHTLRSPLFFFCHEFSIAEMISVEASQIKWAHASPRIYRAVLCPVSRLAISGSDDIVSPPPHTRTHARPDGGPGDDRESKRRLSLPGPQGSPRIKKVRNVVLG